jgi:hypothetical protein
MLAIWRSDFGRNALSPTASSQQWAEPLKLLAEHNGRGNGEGSVHDHDIVLALTPQKVDALADRFNRVRQLIGKKKGRFNALITLTTDEPSIVQPAIEQTLDRYSKRWTLDEVVSPEGKPSELSYLVKLRKSMPGDALLTEIRSVVGSKLLSCDLELSEALEEATEAETEKAAG